MAYSCAVARIIYRSVVEITALRARRVSIASYTGKESVPENVIYTVNQKKTRHQTLGQNFTNYYPIFNFFSLADWVVNLQQIHVSIFHHAFNMSLHYLVKYECRKWHHSEIRIAINDESQDSIAKNLSCDQLLYYTFIIHSAGERIFKIGEHLAKLRAKSLTVSYTPFALHFCPQKCRSRQISWITCVLQTETVIKRCYVNRQINVS